LSTAEVRKNLEAKLKSPDPKVRADAAQALKELTSCFAAGTPFETPTGSVLVENIRAGDVLWSRPEYDVDGLVEPKVVEEVFVRTGRILHVVARGRTIRTTTEHPFWVLGKGWVEASQLLRCDLLCGRAGQLVAVEDVVDTGEYETVYNVRVADFHTYFVGCPEWGWSAWAHNADCARFQWKGKQWTVLDRDGKVVSRGATKQEALQAARGKILEDDYFALDLERQLSTKLKPEGYLADAGEHLKSLGTDALGQRYPGKTIGGGKTHAHHIVMQEGTGVAGQAAVEESQAILHQRGINPFLDRENLVWAPNNGYLRTDEYAKQVLLRLKRATQTKEGITTALKEIAETVAGGGRLTKLPPL
jgi:hypothetical protein